MWCLIFIALFHLSNNDPDWSIQALKWHVNYFNDAFMTQYFRSFQAYIHLWTGGNISHSSLNVFFPASFLLLQLLRVQPDPWFGFINQSFSWILWSGSTNSQIRLSKNYNCIHLLTQLTLLLLLRSHFLVNCSLSHKAMHGFIRTTCRVL